MTGRLLIVEDEQTHREMLQEALAGQGYTVDIAACGQDALGLLSRHHYEAVLLDIRLPDMDGMQLLRVLRERQPECLVLMMTGQAAVAAAVEAMKLGAYDYLAKPFRVDLLLMKLERLLQYQVLRQQKEAGATETGQSVMIGRSAPVLRLLDLVDNVAKTDATILLLGETGSGKGLLARLIHERSRRNQKPLVGVNCAAIPENLIEAELFGYEKGAFTGAHKQHPGLLEQAHEGTLFLDEVGDIPLGTQVKLLRALEERVVYRLGGTSAVSVDFRLLTATNRNLEQLRRDGTIREDFFYRLNVIPVNIPPLRDRNEDIPLLASHFLQKHAHRHQLAPSSLAPETMERLCRHSWPGNVRELENLLERLLVLRPGQIIQPQDLPSGWGGDRATGSEFLHSFRTDLTLRAAVQDFEVRFIQRVLDEELGSRTRTAERLGISRKNLWEKLTGNDDRVT
jgi:DNA-binding NtrC family response regulator